MNDPQRFEFRADGALWHLGRDGWQEAICPLCHEPIQWCLDMFSFTTGFPHRLAHARCVWTPEAFEREIERAAHNTGTSPDEA